MKRTFDTVMVSPTGRETISEFARRWQMHPLGYTLPFQPIIDIDFSALEERVATFHPDFAAPYGRRGQFCMTYSTRDCIKVVYVAISGNARDRRREVRAWKRQGYTVQPHN